MSPAHPQAARALALCFAIGFAAMAHRVGWAVLYPAIVSDQGWSVAELNAAYSVGNLLYTAAVVLVGVALDRYGVRILLLIGAALLAVSLALLSTIDSLWQVYLLYSLVGVASAAMGFLPMLKLATILVPGRLGGAVGAFSFGQGIGSILVSPLMQGVVEAVGWRPGFLLLGLFTVLIVVPLAFAFAPGGAARPRRGTLGAASIRQLAGQPAFWIMLVSNAAIGYLLLLPAHQVAHLMLAGLPGLLAATMAGTMGFCIGIGGLAAGWWADRWGPGWLGLAGAVALVAGLGAAFLAAPDAAWLGWVYAVAAGLGRGAIGVNSAFIQGRVFAGPNLGKLTGVFELGFGSGSSSGIYLTALWRDLSGSFAFGLISASAAGLLCACSSLLLWRRTGARGEGR